MAESVQIKSFAGGMNKDLSYSMLPENTYIHAENFKLITSEGSTGFTIENAEGNSQVINLGDSGASYRIAGHCYIAPYLVVFTTRAGRTEDPESEFNTSIIVRIRIDKDTIQQYETIYTDGGALGYLYLSVTHPIKAVGYYESEDNIKVYWVDGYNETRYMNIMDEDLATQTVDKFSFLSDFPDLSSVGDARPEFIEYTTGNLKVSKVQYAYQYYKTNGSATKFAPLSRIIPIAKQTPLTFSYFKGGVDEEPIGVGCKIKINSPATKTYDRIRLVALDYLGASDVPTVRVFAEQKIELDDTNEELYFIDTGKTINEIVYEDFLVYGNTVYTAKDVATKDKMLFLANINEGVYDVDFDARAYRFNNGGPISRIYASNGDYIDIADTGAWTHSNTIDSGLDWTIPEEFDCINRFNSVDYEDGAAYAFLYLKNGTTLGAEGKNITVEFCVNTTTIDTVGKGTEVKNLDYGALLVDSAAHPLNGAYNMSFQRHEVYRLGIVFFNDKYQPSPVKWVCDLKMPSQSATYQHCTLQSGTDYTDANALGVEVTMASEAMPADAHAWQTVMVKRTSEDRSVLAAGILQTPQGDDAGSSPPAHTWFFPKADNTKIGVSPLTTQVTVSSADYGGKIMMFYSPEINFYQNLTLQAGDFFQYDGYFDYTAADNSAQVNSWDWAAHKLNEYTGVAGYDLANKSTLSDFKIVGQGSEGSNTDITANVVTIGLVNYSNFAGETVTSSGRGNHGTLGLGYSANPIDISSAADRISYVTYRRNKFNSQYGGNSYFDRQRNEYYGIGEVKYTHGTTGDIFEGDTYIDYFYYVRQSTDLENGDGDDSVLSTLLFPVETTIGLGYRHDVIETTDENFALVREISGVYSATKGAGAGDNLYYSQSLDLYQYNNVYSLFDSGQKYLDILLDQSDQVYFPTRIRNSDIKIGGEILDSFTVFRENNYIEVDGEFGPINNVENFKNTLLFWQNTGFGTVAVNDRALIQDNNPGILALGAGGVLDRYDYISRKSGNQNKNSIVLTDGGVYWPDTISNEICRFDSALNKVSKTHGLQSWFNANGKMGWVIGVYDRKYNDVIFTISFARLATRKANNDPLVWTEYTLADQTGLATDGTEYNAIIRGLYASDIKDGENNVIRYISNGVPITAWCTDTNYSPDSAVGDVFYFNIRQDPEYTYTLSYNEQIQKFVSFHSYTPYYYIGLDQTFLSTTDNYKLYKHSAAADRCTYYGTVYDSVIRTVFNKDYPYTKVFDNIKWVSEARDSDGVNQFKDTFSEVAFYNDHQHTGNRDLYYQHDTAVGTLPIPVSRRERTWSLQVPRNIVDVKVELNPDITDSSNWDATQEFKERMRDKYLIGNFVYDNTDGNIFSVPFISINYRRSFR